MVKRFVRNHSLAVRKTAAGYVLTNDGKLEHRLIYESNFGPIPKGYVVHHVDGVKENNLPMNLIAIPPIVHNRLHDHMNRNGFLNRDAQLAFCKPLTDKFESDLMKLRFARSKLFELMQEVARLEESIGLSGKIRAIDRRAVTKLMNNK